MHVFLAFKRLSKKSKSVAPYLSSFSSMIHLSLENNNMHDKAIEG